MLKVAITGAIASGKSTVCLHLEELGYKVFYSDLEAKILLTTNEKLRTLVKDSFGSLSFKEDGSYNSSYIANIIFKDPEARKKMNTIMRSFIVEAFYNFCDRNEKESIVFYEGAVVFENNLYILFNKVICCYCSIQDTISRLRSRNNYTMEEIQARIASQLPAKFYVENSDYKVRTSSNNWKSYLESVLRFLDNKGTK